MESLESMHELIDELRSTRRTWLVTGVAGFIGSNLLETLLRLDQKVVGIDNFSTGYRHNLEDVRRTVSRALWEHFSFVEGDICDIDDCRRAAGGVDYVLHQAALGSVPRSIEDPLTTNRSNIDGFLNMLVASREAGVRRFVYAASSSTYGDSPELPKREDKIGRPLSPYAVTKYVNELYADVFSSTYGIETMGMRYFNVFGPRQDPKGAYAAVIPCWIQALLDGGEPVINGDGETSRDFCYIDNVVQANLLAATTPSADAVNQVYNVAVGDRTTLNELFDHIRTSVASFDPRAKDIEPVYGDFRAGDVRHSQADISKAARLLGYRPAVDVEQGLQMTVGWFAQRHSTPPGK